MFFRYQHHQEDTSYHYDKAFKVENFYTAPIFLTFVLKIYEVFVYVYHKKFTDRAYTFLFQFYCNLQRQKNILWHNTRF